MNNNTKNTSTTSESEWATVAELASIYNVSAATIRRWVRKHGNVRYFMEPSLMRIHRKDFESFMEEKIHDSMAADGHGDYRG